jgi:p-hydroxybenzoate 3-monooxygenase
MLYPGAVMRFDHADHRIDFADLVGKHVMVYSQHKVVQDLIAPRIAAGGQIVFAAEDVSLHDFATGKPHIRYRHDGAAREIDCDIIAGCDDFHGISRSSIPAGVLRVFEREYPFGWLGILAEAPPATAENVYVSHERGFALLAMRSPTRSRLYLQCAPDEDLAAWSDDHIWTELRTRAAREGFRLADGPILQRGITPMRSFVVEPMQCGHLYLAGDAAHIVPPTGAKGLNLAAADVSVLTRAIVAFYRQGTADVLDAYSATRLRRIWKVQRFILVDDDAAASLLRSHAVRAADAGGGARLCVQFARRHRTTWGCLWNVSLRGVERRSNPHREYPCTVGFASGRLRGHRRGCLYSSTTNCVCTPSPSTDSFITSPTFRNTGSGFTPWPTPGGVPVAMTSPACSVMKWLI